MNATIKPLTQRPAWKALAATTRRSKTCIFGHFSPMTETRPASDSPGGGPLPGLFEEPHHQSDLKLLSNWPNSPI